MRIFAKIFFLVLLISSAVLSQELKEDHIKAEKHFFDPLKDLQVKFDDFDYFLELNHLKNNLQVNNDPDTKWLWTSLAISGSDRITSENNSFHFTSFQHNQYLQNSKFNPVRYILGMAQAGAVGYLAYKHIKKYGFLK